MTLSIPTSLQSTGPITKKFWEFHQNNPTVYTQLRDLAIQLKNAGHRKYGMKGLFEVLRWQRALQTRGSTFKLNNNYTALYARLLMHNELSLSNFFDLRESSDQVIE
jgi:hypothetical protein